MLKSLHIKDIVLIERLTLDFMQGLSALTGETGAGKSILLDSLGLAIGARAEAGLVRKGSDGASVTAEVELPPGHPALDLLTGQGMEAERDLILRRTLTPDGRSKAFINDLPVGIAFLRAVGETLIDIHGQFETYGLLNPALHRSVLDDYAKTASVKARVTASYREWQSARDALDAARAAAAAASMNEAWLRDSVKDLQALNPQPGEEDELLSLRTRLQSRDAVVQAITQAESLLADEDGADAQVGQAWRALSKVAEKIGDEVKETLEILDRASHEIQQAHRSLASLMRDAEIYGQDPDSIEDRLYALRAQARKHHCQVNDLPALLDDMSSKLKIMDHQDHVVSDLEKKIAATRNLYRGEAQALHDQRMDAAARLDKLVNTELAPLKMDKAKFQTAVIEMNEEINWGPQGFDNVAFLVTTNAGAEAAPLNKIASGGEMARFMLALKVVLAEASDMPSSYVFDEIDTGIGGATASAVGERLARLAERHQVLVITHSPQVAARADHHWLVAKKDARTSVHGLDGDARREEIARMLSGAEITAEARAAALKLLEVRAA